MKKNLLQKIEEGNIKMKPKYFFVLLSSFYGVSIIVATLLMIYFVSFIVYYLNIQSMDHTKEFGFYGLKVYLLSLPWLIIILVSLLGLMVEILSKQFRFCYRKPAIYTIGVVIICITAGSSVIASKSFHILLENSALERETPVVHHLYKYYSTDEPVFFERGKAESISGDSFLLKKPNDQIILVVTTTDTMFRNDNHISDGDIIMVMGKRTPEKLFAKGIYVFDGNDNFIKRRYPKATVEFNFRKLDRDQDPQERPIPMKMFPADAQKELLPVRP